MNNQIDYEISYQQKDSSDCKFLSQLNGTDEIVFLVNVLTKTQKANNSQLKSSSFQKSTFKVFLALVSIPNETVQLYRLNVCEDIFEKENSYIKLSQHKYDLKEFMSNMVVSKTGSSFLIFGSSRLYIGNMIDKDLNGGIINIQEIQNTLFQGDIQQVEFSNLNPNYLIVLSANQYLSIIDTHNLTKPEQEFDLNGLLNQQKQITSSFLKNTEINETFVSFAQSGINSEMVAQQFNILFMTKTGKVFQICPIFPREFLMTANSLNDLSIYFELQREKLLEEQQQTQNFNNGLIQFEQMIKLLQAGYQHVSDNYACISLKDHKFDNEMNEISPYLQGPLTIKFEQPINSEKKSTDIFSKIFVSHSLPFSLMRCGQTQVDLVMTFYQPEFVFQSQNIEKSDIYQDNLNLMKIGNIDLKNFFKANESPSVTFHQDELDSTSIYFQNREHLFEINAKFLEELREKLIEDEVINASDFQNKLRTQLLVVSDLKLEGQYLVTRSFQAFAGVNEKKPKELIFTLEKSNSLDNKKVLNDFDKAMEQQQKLIQITDEVQRIQPITFMQEINIPEFKFDQTKMNDELYVKACLSKFQNFMMSEYIPQFENLDDIIQEKVSHLDKLKIHFIKSAKAAQLQKCLLDDESDKLHQKIAVVSKNQEFIQEKILQMTKKLNELRTLGNDEFVIQFFIEKLARQVKESKEKLSSATSLLKQKLKLDEGITDLLKNVKRIDNPQELTNFIVKQRVEIDSIQRKINELKL
eukprot:403365993